MKNKKSKYLCIDKNYKMLTKMNLSEEEIRVLNYERFHYPCLKIQKKLHSVYLKVACGYSNTEISRILDIHFNSVARYIKMDNFEVKELLTGLSAVNHHAAGMDVGSREMRVTYTNPEQFGDT
ncbi:MAG: hypothetical protein LBK58_05445 [Prevotellaceae bacterium]|jgi:hypothetical protein|nr:hypothetical protein [Prevotellaceae bacterium]